MLSATLPSSSGPAAVDSVAPLSSAASSAPSSLVLLPTPFTSSLLHAAASSSSTMSSSPLSSSSSAPSSASSLLGSAARVSSSSFVLPSVPAKLKANRAERRPDHVVKRRFHNSCHVCKCGASPGVEHVRCRCGIMFCGRPRCCKRLGVEWSAFVKELMAGGQCAHCNSLTPQGIVDGVQCPNSNCKQKKKKGQESRKYSVGVVTSAQEVTPFSVSAAAAAAAANLPGLAVGMKGAAGLLHPDVSPSLSQISLSSFVPSIGSLSLQSNLPTVANTNPIASLPLSQILALLGQQQQQQQSNANAGALLPSSASSLGPLSLSLTASSSTQPLLSPQHPHAPSIHQQQQAAAAAALIAASASVSSPGLSTLQLSGLGGSLPDGLSLTTSQLKLLQSQLSPSYSSYSPQTVTAAQSQSSLPQSIQHTSQSMQLQPHTHPQSQSTHIQSPTTQRIADSAIAALLQANQQQQLQALHNAHMRIQQQQSLYPPVAPIASFSSASLSSPPAQPPSSASPPASMEELLVALIRQQQTQPQPHQHSQHAPQHNHPHQPQPQPHHGHHQLSHGHAHQQSLSAQQSQSGQSFGGIPVNASLASAYLRQSAGVGLSGGDVVLSNMQVPAAYNPALFTNAPSQATAGPLGTQALFSSPPYSHALSATGSPSSSHLVSFSSQPGSSLPASHQYIPPSGAPSDGTSAPLLATLDGAHDDDRGSKWRKKIKRDEWSGPSGIGNSTTGSSSISGSGRSGSGGSTSGSTSGSGSLVSTSSAPTLMDGVSSTAL